MITFTFVEPGVEMWVHHDYEVRGKVHEIDGDFVATIEDNGTLWRGHHRYRRNAIELAIDNYTGGAE